ncbi:hypothetical protein A2382_01915 [Candidatus Woesebacteria bacterium RIFOXYB1_FULL_38_16]|uniref:Uncharacterized protein n=1 Tax=Candidatus Woesebacteria bacterium RIFOXYB1_FULL_38_16 TaxID=1802538 RepID=A0A1F8CTI9_9BACT|nr:MAG: hypothetical protein A2191_02520 [Candidatus Woesebacteria bacterium RIFOXYA1_FULL_38_9]OGM79657.1 MAG: hypothetical protein A2382_01915 [Candidatus Woesebacteria bacterium RIFOXYB1_FULL_38_16]
MTIQKDAVLLFFHPTDGMIAQTDLTFQQAMDLAHELVERHYNHVQIMEGWTLTGCFIMEDDNSIFFNPKPWPLASVYHAESFTQVMGKIPAWLVLLAVSQNHYRHFGFDTWEEARDAVAESAGQYGCIVENNNSGGQTITWENSDIGVTHVVGFIIPLNE